MIGNYATNDEFSLPPGEYREKLLDFFPRDSNPSFVWSSS